MPAHPHRHEVHAAIDQAGTVLLHAPGLPSLAAAAPRQPGWAGDAWPPQTLLVAAAVTCFVLVFRAMATASGLAWRRLDCLAEGVLDGAEGLVRITAMHLRAHLALAVEKDEDRAKRLLERAKATCLVTRSPAAHVTLTPTVTIIPGTASR